VRTWETKSAESTAAMPPSSGATASVSAVALPGVSGSDAWTVSGYAAKAQFVRVAESPYRTPMTPVLDPLRSPAIIARGTSHHSHGPTGRSAGRCGRRVSSASQTSCSASSRLTYIRNRRRQIEEERRIVRIVGSSDSRLGVEVVVTLSPV